jgi:hypothetical protein
VENICPECFGEWDVTHNRCVNACHERGLV